MFNKRDYKVAIAIELNSLRMCPVNGVFETSAGPNLLHADMVKLDWKSPIRVIDKRRLSSAINQKVEDVDTIIHINMGEARVRVTFGIIKNLAVPVLLRTSFIAKFVKGIFPTERKIVPYNRKPVSMERAYEAPDDNQITMRTTNITDCSVLE